MPCWPPMAWPATMNSAVMAAMSRKVFIVFIVCPHR